MGSDGDMRGSRSVWIVGGGWGFSMEEGEDPRWRRLRAGLLLTRDLGLY
jgi:hypothetical protein